MLLALLFYLACCLIRIFNATSENWRKLVCGMAILRRSSYLLQEGIVEQLDMPIV